MRQAVAVSPHLDDAVFSAGATIGVLVAAGWRVRVVTCFTASVLDPSPFALSTQRDKGLGPDVDYMALRRGEDAAACGVLGADPVHLPLPEAPHRGYTSARDLFAGVHDDDQIADDLRAALAPHLAGADVVLAPQALGDHADHRLVVEVVAALTRQVLWWRDTPYVLRRPDGAPWVSVPAGRDKAVNIATHLPVKIAAARCYATQLSFQFGGGQHVEPQLRRLAAAEAARTGSDGPSEVFTLPTGFSADGCTLTAFGGSGGQRGEASADRAVPRPVDPGQDGGSGGTGQRRAAGAVHRIMAAHTLAGQRLAARVRVTCGA